MIRVVNPGSGSRILRFYPSRIQGSKRYWVRIRIRNTGFCEPLPWRGRFHRPAPGEEEPFCRLPSLLRGGLEQRTWQAFRRSWKAFRCPEHSWSFCSRKTYRTCMLYVNTRYVNSVKGDWFQLSMQFVKDPDPAFLAEYRSGSRVPMTKN